MDLVALVTQQIEQAGFTKTVDATPLPVDYLQPPVAVADASAPVITTHPSGDIVVCVRTTKGTKYEKFRPNADTLHAEVATWLDRFRPEQ